MHPGWAGVQEGGIRSMVTGDLAIETSQGFRESRISVTGRLVIESSPGLRALLRKAIHNAAIAELVIDVSGLSYLDTSGLATLLEAARLACLKGRRLRVVGIGGEPKMLAEIAELDRIFRAYGSDVELT
jgi:anti-sigma B factor antagonist